MFLNWLGKSKFSAALMLLSQTLPKAFHKHPDIFGKVSSVRGISTILRYLEFFWIFLFLLTYLSPIFYALFKLIVVN